MSTYEIFDNNFGQYHSLVKQIWDLLLEKNTSNILNRKIDSLSGGEFQLLNLLLTLSKPDTDIIILDEPFSNISTNIYQTLLDILNKLSEDKIIIIISHDSIPEYDKEVVYIG